MDKDEFLIGVDLIWAKLSAETSEVKYAELKDRLTWLVSEYKDPNKETENWWKDGL